MEDAFAAEKLIPFEPHEFTDAELASQDFLLKWDTILAGALEQLKTTMRNRAPDVRRFLASFDLLELQTRAAQAMDKKCLGAHLLAIGGYNIIFLLSFEDQTDILARLRIPGGGLMNNGSDMTPQELSARFVSEVATMRFVKARTSIPVPELYHWDADPANPVGAAYMLMERISGVLLGPGEITAAGLTQLVTQIAGFEVEVCNNALNSIGCLVDADGTIGPLVPSCTYGLVPNDNGPFRSSKQFLLACVAHELDEVRATEQWIAQRTKCSEFNGGVDALSAEYAERWFQLLHQAITTLPDELPTHPDVFRLVHTDFNDGNLLVSSAEDPTIVAVLDWEGARVLPVWDARAGSTISWLVQSVEQADDKARLWELYHNITTQGGRVLGQSPLCWEELIPFFESAPSVTMDRERLNEGFQSWFVEVEKTSKESCPFDLESFRPLTAFIMNGCV